MIDKSKTRVLSKINEISQILLKDNLESTKKVIENFQNDIWFFKVLKEKFLCENLEFSYEGEEKENFFYLLYAYSHPATILSFVNVCYAIFGKNSKVDIKILSPATIYAKIKIDNKQFIKLLENLEKFALLETKDKKALFKLTIFDALSWKGDIASFMLQFIPFGYDLNIDISS